jgi:hypothetical protein
MTFANDGLGRRLRRIPDGETGIRINWTRWQEDVFAKANGLTSEIFDTGYLKRRKFRLKPGAGTDEIEFPPLGYAKAARQSYAEFVALKERGRILDHLKFQVCLPTPLACTVLYVSPDDQSKIEPAYEAAMLREVDDIAAAVPAADLCIQWDAAVEFAVLENVFPHAFGDPMSEVSNRLARIANYIPREVELGLHLCYGDSGGKHFTEPKDTTKLVAVANSVTTRLKRLLQWLHLPVPRDRSDPDYYEALGNLNLPPDTEFYLGLIHHSDGEQGARRRIRSAGQFVAGFGVATECGWGRQKADVLPSLMAIHTQVSEPWQ